MTDNRVRTLHEPILVATLGNLKHKALPSLFDGVAREHSRKPDEFYRLVAEYAPGRRADLFSRETRPGFEGWGDELGKFDEIVLRSDGLSAAVADPPAPF
jgi:N6-adenosine-specific RNA methylase IME4